MSSWRSSAVLVFLRRKKTNMNMPTAARPATAPATIPPIAPPERPLLEAGSAEGDSEGAADVEAGDNCWNRDAVLIVKVVASGVAASEEEKISLSFLGSTEAKGLSNLAQQKRMLFARPVHSSLRFN